MKKLRIVFLIIFSFIIVFGIYNIFSSEIEYKKAIDTYVKLKENVRIPEVDDSKEEVIEVDFDSLKKVNSNIFSWIYIENTNISYPVVQGKDNDYYLNHLADGSYNPAGSIFLDYRNKKDFSDKHTIIYGHYTTNGTMFGELNNYKKQSFFDKQPYYLIITSDKTYRIDIISSYVTDVKSSSWKLDFSGDEEFEEWIKYTKDKSLIDTEVVVDKDSHIITLSTCNRDFENARFVLVGVLNEV